MKFLYNLLEIKLRTRSLKQLMKNNENSYVIFEVRLFTKYEYSKFVKFIESDIKTMEVKTKHDFIKYLCPAIALFSQVFFFIIIISIILNNTGKTNN